VPHGGAEAEYRPMNVLVIDNYDSFTFNLVQMIGEALGRWPRVLRNDAITPHELAMLRADAIIVSPGPGHPGRARDFGICRTAMTGLGRPALGVCLGHQGLGHYHGAYVGHAPEVMHGRTSRVTHNGSALFHGIPQGFTAVRYHSLAIRGDVPQELEVTAWSEDGVLMGIRHRSLPLWGVQFHPESIGTEHGATLIRNFLALAGSGAHPAPRRHLSHGPRSAVRIDRRAAHPERAGREDPDADAHCVARPGRDAGRTEPRLGLDGLRLTTRALSSFPDPETVFVELFGEARHAFWLDSALHGPGVARFSYMGSAAGPSSAVLIYEMEERTVTVTRGGVTEQWSGRVLDLLDGELKAAASLSSGLPFEFQGGFVGYLGYELKRDCGYPSTHPSPYPDAAVILADRCLVFDHLERRLHLMALTAPGDGDAAERWFDEVTVRLERTPPTPRPPTGGHEGPMTLSLRRERADYLDDISRCKREIDEGESYEICLTNEISTGPVRRPLDLYRILRSVSPAPYAAYLRFGSLAVLSSSPERFLRITRDGHVSAKPIKGTARRSDDPAEDARLRDLLASSVKDRAENLMIVDLLRNDLGSVCQLGSVGVPTLMDVESFATVHHLVSTVSGLLRPDRNVVDCLRAAFPGGSMTGAPKARTLEILDRLEPGPRGVYSGCIGWLGLDGAAELSIVIRTAVATPERTTIGVGGAIVALSDPDVEFDETMLKAAALAHSLAVLRNGTRAS
jgi:para-aminobenzoate synthetase